MSITRRRFCQSLGASLLLAHPACASAANGIFRPENFGARGDGVTNDSDAFGALAQAVNTAGGGTIILGCQTYLIGRQNVSRASTADFAFTPDPLLEFKDCRLPLEIRGNGARLVCAPGLRFGSFDPITNAPVRKPLPLVERKWRSTPYSAMIAVTRSSAPVLIENLELDGNSSAMLLGGRWGDVGWQIPGSGIVLVDNRGGEVIRDVHSHDHPLDGLIVDGKDADSGVRVERLLERVRATGNGRQGVSVVGGRGYIFRDCEFGRSGRGKIQSPPGAGVDIEAEGGKRIRNLSFERCTFFDNFGPAMVSDTGDSEFITFKDCRFVGTTYWSAWPHKPSIAFHRCTFIGALSNTYGHSDLQKATRFIDCQFLDDPELAGGRVFLGGGETGPIADLSNHQNILFERCQFKLTHSGLLPWSTGAIYSNCIMNQANPRVSYPRGTYQGRNIISGAVDLSGSRNLGELMRNGRRVG